MNIDDTKTNKKGNKHNNRAKGIDQDQVIKMFKEEQPTLQAIGDQFGVSRERIRQILVKHGITDRKGIVTVEVDAKQVLVKRLAGHSWEDIAKDTGVSVSSLRKAMPANANKTIYESRRKREVLSRIRKPDGDDGCWYFDGCTDKEGRARATWHSTPLTVYKILFYFENGHFSKNWLTPTCKNKRCVNLSHYREVTPLESARLRKKPGRGRNHQRLTDRQVDLIRSKVINGATKASVAREMGIGYERVLHVMKGVSHSKKIKAK